MKNTFAAMMFAILTSLFAAGNANAGIPVIDVEGNLQSAIAQIANYAQYIEQVVQLKNQLQQAKQTFDSLNGVRGMAALINNPTARQYLPASSQGIYQLATGNAQFSGLSGSLAAIKAATQIMKPSDMMNSSTGASVLLNKQQNQLATMQATAEASFDAAGARFATLQTLIDQVDLANDPKAAADLQNRIQAEQAMMQNEVTKLNMLAMISNAQEKQLSQQGRESSAKMGSGQPVYVNGF